MPEAGYIPIPKKLAREGIKDMLRISDGRMSGTASGAVILHVSPEAAVGGPLAIVRDGDMIKLDVEARSLILDIPEEEIKQRLGEWSARTLASREEVQRERGYRGLYKRSVLQADQGADFDFLRADYGRQR